MAVSMMKSQPNFQMLQVSDVESKLKIDAKKRLLVMIKSMKNYTSYVANFQLLWNVQI